MVKHLFKLIWKQKKTNFLMMFEIFISFLILFAVCTLGVYFFRNYQQPPGLTTEHIWALYCSFNSDTLREHNQELIKQKLKEYPEVKKYTLVDNNIPFSFSSSNRQFNYQNNSIMSEYMRCEPELINILKLKLNAGNWLTFADKSNKYQPTVINQAFKDKLFGQEDALGKVLNTSVPGSNEPDSDQDKYQVIGVVENFKFEDEFQKITPCMWTLVDEWSKNFLVEVQSGVDAGFEAKLTKDLINLGTGWTIEVQHLEDMKTTKNKLVLVPMLILIIVCGFLVFNVALGLFGVLFQTITRRKSEIGVRRAMGATRGHIVWQFIGETIFIATLGIALGLFFAVQFLILNVFDVEKSTYFFGILVALISLYLLVILCAIIPSRQSLNIYPATALHED
ncbi:MAG: FtsX-like permease family protein [Saprospiraceae bacterium]|nr:FtsX-like permease family protein [Saprospiraceae bacterium]